MSNEKFGFGKKEEGKKTTAEEALESAADSIQAAQEKAQLLLHSEPCQKFLEEYKTVEQQIVDVLINYSKTELNNHKFGEGARVLLLQILNLRVLVDKVHSGTGEKYSNV